MWKRFIKTRCSVISYYWHKSSLVLSFSVSSILQDVFIESGKRKYGAQWEMSRATFIGWAQVWHSILRFSYFPALSDFYLAALCTTNFPWFWFHGKPPWCGSTLHRAASSDWIYVEIKSMKSERISPFGWVDMLRFQQTWSAYRGKDTTFRRSFCGLQIRFCRMLLLLYR